MKYWWLALLIVGIFAIETYIVWLMRNNRKACMITLFVISTILLVYKTVEFAYYRIAHKGLYPVEFSHITYFVLGVTVCFGIKKMRAFAGICSVLAGFGYIVAACFSPDSIITEASAVYYIPLAIIQHEVLWFAGCLLLFNTDKYSLKDIWVPLVGVVAMIVFSILVSQRIIYKDFAGYDNMIIIKIITGRIVEYLIGAEKVTVAKQAITASVLIIAAIGIFVSFYFVNNYAFKRREKNGSQIKGADFEIGLSNLILKRK
ncbi:MAG: hypothetical protein K2I78_00325 [Clostridia bacterium]|nr:hypothetical protein [Clostridia bacterium]MDE7215903.1 hypothetical protein [Clostridia bacterium]MDE7336891.1 hypothetical protein [Clostridia bacterium]